MGCGCMREHGRRECVRDGEEGKREGKFEWCILSQGQLVYYNAL